MESRDKVSFDVPGKTSKIEHRIKLVDKEPVRSITYPLQYALKQELKSEITEMLNIGIIWKSSLPYALLVVIVKKNDGLNCTCICINYRKLNKSTISDLEPMKTSKDLFQQLGKSRFFSKIYLSKDYWQIPVVEVNVSKIRLVTTDEAYEFFRMPFDMKNYGATLVCGMREVLLGMSAVETYKDDLIVFSSNCRTLIKTLKDLLRRLSDANLTARPSKCIFGAYSVEFLEHDMIYEEITPNSNNLAKIACEK